MGNFTVRMAPFDEHIQKRIKENMGAVYDRNVNKRHKCKNIAVREENISNILLTFLKDYCNNKIQMINK